ncbi:MAG: LytTR family transcriptional regulator [Muribaculaceae bacterium]|nr:LytTR family transcriptional regulator [Muribaculaceae bacterium]
MAKICLNSRDELIILDLERVAFFQANGNYTLLTYLSGQKQLLTLGLSKIETVIRAATPPGHRGTFLRLGRSLIVNKQYIITISVTKQKLYLGDYTCPMFGISVSKPLLKALKDEIAASYSSPHGQTTENKADDSKPL